MTIEEAIEKITSDIELADYREEDSAQLVDIESLKVAIKALEKQVAKKVTIDFPYEICPTCGGMYLHYIYKHYPDRYCPACGQKLKWREEDEID